MVLVVGLVILAGVMGFLLTRGTKTDVDTGKQYNVGDSLIEILKNPVVWIRNLKQTNKSEQVGDQVVGTVNEYVMSYGEEGGMETQLVRGRVVGWGETWMEMETEGRDNYPLLLPDKTVRVRCLPLTVVLSDGKVSLTRDVYVDMTQSKYLGKLVSVFNARELLPVGSEVLGLVGGEVASGEVTRKVLAGYGCSLGEKDPLEMTN